MGPKKCGRIGGYGRGRGRGWEAAERTEIPFIFAEQEKERERAIASQLSSSKTNRTLNSGTSVAKICGCIKGATWADRALTSAKRIIHSRNF